MNHTETPLPTRHVGRVLVQKFGGTSVDSEESRAQAAAKVVRAVQAGWSVVVVVSAIGRKGQPYATDTLLTTLRDVDPQTPPAARESDLLAACGEIISTVILAQTLRSRGLDTVALTGGQAGIVTDYEFSNARILSIDPAYVVRSLEAGKVVLVAGFQGVTRLGAITTLGRGGSDTTASALGAALKPFASEVSVEIYTDVDGVKTADPRLVSEARTLSCATYEEVAEMAHLGAKVVHPRAAEIANQYGIPLWVKSTFSDAPGTLITAGDCLSETDQRRVTGVTHTGKLAYIRFFLPCDRAEVDKDQVELEVYRVLQAAHVPLYLNSTDGEAFCFAVDRSQLGRLRDALDGLVVPMGAENGAATHVYLLGLGDGGSAYQTQKRLLSRLNESLPVCEARAEVTENCTVVSVIATGFRGVPGVMALILETLDKTGVPVYQTADSAYSISVLVPEADAPKAAHALHQIFRLGKSPETGIK
jgi:aspartate kinase